MEINHSESTLTYIYRIMLVKLEFSKPVVCRDIAKMARSLDLRIEIVIFEDEDLLRSFLDLTGENTGSKTTGQNENI